MTFCLFDVLIGDAGISPASSDGFGSASPHCPPRRLMLHCPLRCAHRRNPGARRTHAGVFMSSPDPSAVADQPSAGRKRLVLIVYTAAIFVSALLLFSVPPLFTKMGVAPRRGA